MQSGKRLLSTVIAGGVTGVMLMSAGPAWAKYVRLWSSDDLWRAADVVVLADAGPTQALKSSPGQKPGPGAVVTVDTTFTVSRVLKGSVQTKSLRLTHQEYSAPDYVPEVLVNGGPSVISFHGQQKFPFLLFLKHGQGDLYEPVSGIGQPSPSVEMVVPYQGDSPFGPVRADIVPKAH